MHCHVNSTAGDSELIRGDRGSPHPDLSHVTDQKGLKIISWNIRSLVRHFDEVSVLLDGIGIDIINFNETWMGRNNPNYAFRLEDYKIYRNDRTDKKKGGGLCTYIRGSIRCDAAKYQNLNVSNPHLESLTLEIIQPQTRPIILLNVYRPPNGKITEAISDLQNIMNQCPTNAEIFIVGDLNIDLSNANSPSSQSIKQFESVNNLKQLIDKNTCVTIGSNIPTFVIRKKIKIPKVLTTFECHKLKFFNREQYKEK